MVTWNELAEARPDLAMAGRALLYQHDVGLAYLATLRSDGRPRLHPVCPLLCDEGLYGFIIPSPKQRDLRRDGWYSMHSFPVPDNEDAFSLSGRAEVVDDGSLRARLSAQFVAERARFAVPAPAAGDELFRFDLDACLWTHTTGHGDPAPVHEVWREGRPDVAAGAVPAG